MTDTRQRDMFCVKCGSGSTVDIDVLRAKFKAQKEPRHKWLLFFCPKCEQEERQEIEMDEEFPW